MDKQLIKAVVKLKLALIRKHSYEEVKELLDNLIQLFKQIYED